MGRKKCIYQTRVCSVFSHTPIQELTPTETDSITSMVSLLASIEHGSDVSTIEPLPAYVGAAAGKSLCRPSDPFLALDPSIEICIIGANNNILKTYSLDQGDTWDQINSIIDECIKTLGVKFISFGFDSHVKNMIGNDHKLTKLWTKRDIVPFWFQSANGLGDAFECASRCRNNFTGEIPYESLPSGGGIFSHVTDGTNMMLDKKAYSMSVTSNVWTACKKLAMTFSENSFRICFVNSTIRGGGVALMRHSLLRLMNLMDVDMHWLILPPNPAVFRRTKNNHNILQGVTDIPFGDMCTYEAWIRQVAEDWRDIIGSANVIVLDDQQTVGLVKYIREWNICCKIIWRNHIQIDLNALENPDSNVSAAWDYIYDKIRDCDAFVCHPSHDLIPKQLNGSKVYLMPATTDFLDGLNKKLDSWSTLYYVNCLKKLAKQHCSAIWEFGKRPYIVQVARFDPAKGYADLLFTYKEIIERLNEMNFKNHQLPQLVCLGHGSVDDPDQAIILERLYRLIATDDFATLRQDIIFIPCPPVDQLLNVTLRGASVVLQCSSREGYEVKVTEAMRMGKPVVAYAVGGIKRQIKHGINGFLVPLRDISSAADCVCRLMTDEKLYADVCNQALYVMKDHISTVANAASWMCLALKLLAKVHTSAPSCKSYDRPLLCPIDSVEAGLDERWDQKKREFQMKPISDGLSTLRIMDDLGSSEQETVPVSTQMGQNEHFPI